MSVTKQQVVEWCQKQVASAANFESLEVCLDAIPPLESLSSLPAGTRVLIRGDTDVVFDEQGNIEEDVRLQSLVQTLKYGLEKGWVLILYGHRGRDPQLSLKPVAEYMQKLMRENGFPKLEVQFVPEWMDDATGQILDAAGQAVAALPNGSLIVLENTRRYKLEQALWKAKGPDLEGLGDRLTNYANGMREKFAKVHINEGFASSNRDLSSTLVPLTMDKVALGKYIDTELRQHVTRTRLAELVIFSGIKINKLDDLQAILNRGRVKVVIAAGSLAMALKKAAADLDGISFKMGEAGDPNKTDSKIYIPPERIEQAKSMLETGRKNGVEFVLPVDFIIEDGTAVDQIPDGAAQFDIGPKSSELQAKKVGEFIEFSKKKQAAGEGPAVCFHNGVFGLFEKEQFANGTRKFMDQLKRMNDSGVQVYVGGGEGGAALMRYGDESWVTHCFTAGGTILKALGTEPIPYIKALYLISKK
ncbi:MAG: phosphoglycerate kinase [Planctomycetales bacterium]